MDCAGLRVDPSVVSSKVSTAAVAVNNKNAMTVECSEYTLVYLTNFLSSTYMKTSSGTRPMTRTF